MQALNKEDTLIAFSLVGFMLLVFYQTSYFEFINFDDNVYITENPYVLAGLKWESIKWAFSTTYGGHWHPLSWVSHMLDVELFGLSASWSHLINSGIHALNVALLYLLVTRILGDRSIAFFSATIFGIHPLRLESVAWVAERKDVLSMFFGLVTSNLYLTYVCKGSKLTYFVSLVCFALSLLTKPTLITLPVLLILFDVWPLKRTSLKDGLPKLLKSIIEKVPFLLVSALIAMTSIYAQNLGGGLRSLSEVSIENRINMMIPGYLAYIGKLFWPYDLSVFYPSIHYTSGLVAGSSLALIAISFICLERFGSAPQLLFGWLWFLIAGLPTSGLIAVGGQALADRWTYLPHIGPILGIVSLLFQRFPRRATLLCTFISAILLISTLSQLPNWKNSETLFKSALDSTPDNFLAHTNLGTALLEAGKFNQASYHFEEAVRLNPTYPEALNNLGTVRARQGYVIDALKDFDKALSIRPNFEVAKRNRAQALYELESMRGRYNP